MGGYTPQTEITERVTRIQGRFNMTGPLSTDPRIFEGVVDADPGMAVILGSADNLVTLPAAAFTLANFQGVIGWSGVDVESDLSSGDRAYTAEDPVTVAKTAADIEVKLGGTVTKDAQLFFVHTAADPVVECLLVPDLSLAVAERFALKGKRVLVLLTDMTNFSDSLKEIAITMEQVPSNRGYPGDLYSQLASRYEKAVDFEGAGSITKIPAMMRSRSRASLTILNRFSDAMRVYST